MLLNSKCFVVLAHVFVFLAAIIHEKVSSITATHSEKNKPSEIYRWKLN